MILNRYFEFHEKDLDPIKSFHLKDNLNPKVWNNFDIDPEIREQLLVIAKDFYEKVELKADVIDIILCGSLSNYNWSDKYSDFDLHIIINFKEVDDNYELVDKFCDYAKKIWNTNHEIYIKGYEVEIALQDIFSLKNGIKNANMGGVFSLLNNKWIKKPVKIDFEIDESIISSKAKTIMSKVDDIEEEFKEDKPEASEEKISKVWKKIKEIRQSGLSGEGGEYSVGNLVFKLLRRNGYIAKIMDLKKKTYDSRFR